MNIFQYKVKVIILILGYIYSLSLSAIEPQTIQDLTITEGLDSRGEPLSSSDWSVVITDSHEYGCQNIPTHPYYIGEKQQQLIQYFSKDTPDCSQASSAYDALERIDWQDLGLVQNSEFGLVSLDCNPNTREGCDEVILNVTNINQSLVALNPTEGLNGTSSGSVDIFSYDYESLSSVNRAGTGGRGGTLNLNLPQSRPQCVRIFDSQDGEEYARTPTMNVIQYNWQPITSSGGANSGVDGDNSKGKTTLIKGLAPDLIRHIKDSYFIQRISEDEE